jgi:hypothetical protein
MAMTLSTPRTTAVLIHDIARGAGEQDAGERYGVVRVLASTLVHPPNVTF